MSRPTKIALIVLGIFVVLALIIVSQGPTVVAPPRGPMVEEPRKPMLVSDIEVTPPFDLEAASEPETRARLGSWPRPEFRGISRWWNTPGDKPLTAEGLRGKVVLVKFWTYSCINCIRTYPAVKRWHDTYAKDGLVVVGVHTPEFAFERVPENVEREIQKNGFKYPIALDPDYDTWNAFDNHYWPAMYLFDANGILRYTQFGEHDYAKTEAAIRRLLTEAGQLIGATTEPVIPPVEFKKIRTPETYFGHFRASGFANALELAQDSLTTYKLKDLGPNQWTIGGRWNIQAERAHAKQGAIHRMSIQAPRYNIVLDATAGTTATLEVLVDGAPLNSQQKTEDTVIDAQGRTTIKVQDSRLYRIADFPDSNRHVIELRVLEGEVRFYAATFG